MCALLLSRGASPNVRTAGGQTPLHLAASNNESPETIELLLRHPATDRTRANNQGETAETLARRLSPFASLFDSITARSIGDADACGDEMSVSSSDADQNAGAGHAQIKVTLLYSLNLFVRDIYNFTNTLTLNHIRSRSLSSKQYIVVGILAKIVIIKIDKMK